MHRWQHLQGNQAAMLKAELPDLHYISLVINNLWVIDRIAAKYGFEMQEFWPLRTVCLHFLNMQHITEIPCQ